MITDQLIIKESGQYDKEIIHRLRIERRGLQRITNLEGCSSLVELSLSSNNIGVINGLETLLSLRILDLSYNQIRRIENLSTLVALESLNLKGNQITNVEDINELSNLLELKSIHFKGVDGDDANPVCKHPMYMSTILHVLPNLQIIDGGHQLINESFQSMEDHMESMQPDARACKTPPLEFWITEKELAKMNKGGDDIDSIIGGSKCYSSVVSIETSITEMLKEDCSHLLRKAQAAVAKSEKA